MGRINSLIGGAAMVCGLSIVSAATAQTTATATRASAGGARLDHRELAADQQVVHALNRLTFGARPGDAAQVRAIGLDKWIDQQLHPERIDNASLDKFVASYSILNQDQSELLVQYAEAQRDRRMAKRDAGGDAASMSRDDSMAIRNIGTNRRAVLGQLQSARVARAVASNRQLEEVMTDFWLNHFNIFAQKGPPGPFYAATYESEVIRPNSLGKFRELLGAVAKSPAMLFYLDNARSMADSSRPRLVAMGRQRNINRADATAMQRRRANGNATRRRTVSPGANGPVARRGGQAGGVDTAAMMEMQQRINQRRNGGLNENYGRELLELHTLGVDGGYTQQDVINVARALTGWTIKPPQTGGGFIFRPEMHDAGEKTVLGRKLASGRGAQDGEDVLDIVASHPATARHIATKLARRFVSDNPPKALVDQAAAVFLRTDGDIREVVRTIITSNEFFAQQAFRGKVKSPFEVVVSAMRAIDAKPDVTPRTAQAVAYLGQPIYGHQAPNGYPETGDSWMNTGAILNRINFGMTVAANRIPGANLSAIPGLESLASAPRAQQVDAVVAMLLNGSASVDTRAVLLSGENPLLASSSTASVAGGGAMNGETSGNEMMAQEPDAARSNQMARGARRNPMAAGAGVPQLTGIAQMIGLALGSPEFQRR